LKRLEVTTTVTGICYSLTDYNRESFNLIYLSYIAVNSQYEEMEPPLHRNRVRSWRVQKHLSSLNLAKISRGYKIFHNLAKTW